MKISKKNLMAFVKNHAYGEEVLGKGTIRSQTINSVLWNLCSVRELVK
jgi:hypothetical protein